MVRLTLIKQTNKNVRAQTKYSLPHNASLIGGNANVNFNNFSVAQNFKYAGLQNGNQCFCDDTYGRYGKVEESKCTKLCTGDPSLLCGGAWANMIYRTY